MFAALSGIRLHLNDSLGSLISLCAIFILYSPYIVVILAHLSPHASACGLGSHILLPLRLSNIFGHRNSSVGDGAFLFLYFRHIHNLILKTAVPLRTAGGHRRNKIRRVKGETKQEWNMYSNFQIFLALDIVHGTWSVSSCPVATTTDSSTRNV